MIKSQGSYYIVEFEDGTFYKGWNGWKDVKTTKDINEAKLYYFEYIVGKDWSLRLFLEHNDLDFKIRKVNYRKMVEIID